MHITASFFIFHALMGRFLRFFFLNDVYCMYLYLTAILNLFKNNNRKVKTDLNGLARDLFLLTPMLVETICLIPYNSAV